MWLPLDAALYAGRIVGAAGVDVRPIIMSGGASGADSTPAQEAVDAVVPRIIKGIRSSLVAATSHEASLIALMSSDAAQQGLCRRVPKFWVH